MNTAIKFTEADFYAVETERCKRDANYFVNEYVKIEDRDKVGIIIPFKLWDAQKEVLHNFINERLVQVMKANQLGLSWLADAYVTYRLIYTVGYSALGISETEIKAKEMVRRVDFILRHLPDWMIRDKEHKTADLPWYETTALSITIHHPKKENDIEQEDSSMQAFSSSPKAGASFTANLFVFDEWALQEYAREIWTYAFPTINRPTGGQVLGLSTIERGSLFEDIWKNKKNAFKKIFLPWYTDPRRDQKWYDATVAEIGLDETHKHYPATEEEAFAIPGGAFFNEFRSTIHIQQSNPVIPNWYQRYRFMDYGLDMLACYFVYINGQGYGRIYKEIYKPGLVISEASYEILKESGAKVPDTVGQWDVLSKEEKSSIAQTSKDKFVCTFAPPDLFAKSSQTGRASSDVWYDNGIVLTKTKNDFEQGCIAVSEWLHPIATRDEQTGAEFITARMTIDKDSAPNLVQSLLNIQKDKLNPKVYSKKPHSLTHSADALRYFCTEIVPASINEIELARRRQQELNETAFPQVILDGLNVNDGDLQF